MAPRRRDTEVPHDRQGKDRSEPSLRRVLVWAALTFAMAGAAGGTGYLVATAAAEDASAQAPAEDPLLRGVPG